MKIRSGFVSNSSSSSFICDVCGSAEEEYDGEGRILCEEEHSICNNCDSEDYIRIESDDWGEVITKGTCPICTKKVVPDYMKLQYLCNTLGITGEQVAELVRGNIKMDDVFRGINKNDEEKS